ncbi:MAG: cation diffusion facilitator family transporter [Actinomycetota bacterium]|nr:cation diffusion facilitator family transporter [Actinomycetota bacterium]
MRTTPHHEFPPDKERVHRRAVRLEWLTIAYLLSAIVVIYLTLGSSQAMKTAWFEDILSLVPPIAFLVASRIRGRRPDSRHPYGWHRAVSIAYLIASLALLAMGAFLLFDALMSLGAFEHPSIGTVSLFEHEIWLGWLMIPAAAYSAFPAMVLGRLKLPLAKELHDRVLIADAKMNKADWLTGCAAILGVTGIAFGLWWADAVAAAVISTDILHDGISNIRLAVTSLMDAAPERVDESGREGLPARVETEIKKLSWVRDARVRMRDEGHVFFGEVFVVPRDDSRMVERLAEATERLSALDWRLHDVVVVPVPSLEEGAGAGPDAAG